MFLFFSTFLQSFAVYSDDRETLPPINVLQHHSLEQLPKPYWPFSIEQLETEKGFQQDPEDLATNICRYPALAFHTALTQGQDTPNFDQCPELMEFLDKAPIDAISLVYASENLTSPASMMGHVFIKLSGKDKEGHVREHAVSFFTELERFNYAKLLFDTMWRGKQGQFALSPYSQFIETYVHTEKRNLWEYEIDMSETQRKLVQLHLWELRYSDLPYFFDRYNCATLISHILRVGRPEITLPNLDKVSPLDVVKALDQAQLVASKSVVLSSEWQTRMLSNSLSSERVSQIKDHATNAKATDFNSDSERFLYSQLGLSYTDHQMEIGDLSNEASKKLTRYYQALDVGLDDFQVDLSNYKTPSKLPNDSQWFMAYVDREEQSLLRLGYLPAGLRKEDDSRQYFGNNELRLMEGSILIDLDNEKVKVDEFAIYALSSIKPYNSLTGGLSGRFEVIVEDHFDNSLDTQKALDIEGGVGLTKGLEDVSLYVLPTVGAGLSRGDTYLHGAIELGLLIDSVFNSKLSASYTRDWGQLDRSSYIDIGDISLSKYLSHNWTVSLGWKHLSTRSSSLEEYSLGLKYLY